MSQGIAVSLSILVKQKINLDEFTLKWSGHRRDHMIVVAILMQQKKL